MHSTYIQMMLDKQKLADKNRHLYERRVRKSIKQRFKDCLRAMLAFFFTQVGVCGLVVAYTIAGAFLFMEIEAPSEFLFRNNLKSLRDEVISSLWNITYNYNTLHYEQWKDGVDTKVKWYQDQIVSHVKSGYGLDNEKVWSFAAALMYCLTIYTTIGYGNVTPRTAWGKGATIMYALFGIPLMLLYMSNLGDILGKTFKYIYARLCRIRTKRERMIQRDKRAGVPTINEKASTETETQGKIKSSLRKNEVPAQGEDVPEILLVTTVIVPMSACITVMISYVIGGGILFAEWEKWDYVDGSYFCFTSLVTIGFGDFVPGEALGDFDVEGSTVKMIMCYIYILVGMALIAMCFNLMQEEVMHNIRNIAGRLKLLRRATRRIRNFIK